MSLMIIFSTSHRQRGVRLLLLVAGAVLAWFIVLLRAFFFSLSLSLSHFMVYSVETVTEATGKRNHLEHFFYCHCSGRAVQASCLSGDRII